MKTKLRTFLTLSALLCIAAVTHAQVVNTVWAKQLGGAGNEYGWSIGVDPSGNVFVAGFFSGTTDADPGAGVSNLTAVGKNDVFIVKLDAGGGFLWARQIGGPEEDRGNAIAVDNEGNVYITGYFGGTVDFDPGPGTLNYISDYPQRVYWVKLSANGDLVWAKCVESTNSNSSGIDIAVDAAGNSYSTGSFDGSPDFNPGTGTAVLSSPASSNCFVSKFNAAGEFVWARHLAGAGSGEATGLALDDSGNVLTCGKFSGTADFDPGTGAFNLTSAGKIDLYISKLNADGEFRWAKAAGGPENDIANSIAVDGSGNVYATGPFQATGDFDPGSGVVSLTSAGTRNIFILKLGADGNLGWAKMFSGTGSDYSYSIAVDRQGRVFLTGGFKGTTDFDPGSSTASLTTAGDYDWFIAKLDSNGNLVRVNHTGGISYEIGNSMVIDDSGTIYTAGYFGGTADFDPGTGTITLNCLGGVDCFIHKLSQNLSSIDEPGNLNTISLFPNPTGGLLRIASGISLTNAKISVRDMHGRLISEQINRNGCEFTLDLSNQESGIYFIEVSEDRFVSRMKVIKR
jgi:hypothetical protein